MTRKCSACKLDIRLSDFTKNQIRKGKKKRCKECVESDFFGVYKCSRCHRHSDQFSLSELEKGISRKCFTCLAEIKGEKNGLDLGVLRKNRSTQALVNYDRVVSVGDLKTVYLGRYVAGPRADSRCVVKVYHEDIYVGNFFKSEMEVLQTTLQVLKEWNRDMSNLKIVLNESQVWTVISNNTKLLCEPYIENFEKFNSNTGWVGERSQWNQIMQALSHYSYHISDGEFVICDLQGGVTKKTAYISSPAICSLSGKYGPTDLGKEGIENFFARHVCNIYCMEDWLFPPETEHYFIATPNTIAIEWEDINYLNGYNTEFASFSSWTDEESSSPKIPYKTFKTRTNHTSNLFAADYPHFPPYFADA